MRDRQGAQHRSSRLLRPTKLQALLLVLIGAGLTAGVRQRQDAAAASHLGRAAAMQHGQRRAAATAAAPGPAAAQSAPAVDQPRSGLPAAQELMREIGPFEPEKVVAALAAQDAKPEAKVTVDHGGFASEARQGQEHSLPRVALLFLSRGPMPHEPAWRAFFKAAGRLTQGWPQPRQLSRHVVPGQLLFSAYLHAAPGFRSPPNSVFAGLELEEPVQVQWGQHSVAEAERRLFIAALHDRANRRFALLSESCVFLYPPAVVYLEAIAETRSRIDACAHHSEKHRMVYRFHRDMHTDKLNVSVWRKSSQWIILNRKHAAIVAADNEVNPLFVRECWVDTQHHPPHRFCVSDEHYIPTLLAVHGLDVANETDCTGAGTHAIWKWTPGRGAPAHPQMWSKPEEVTPDLVDHLRIPAYARGRCNASEAIASAARVLPAAAPAAAAAGGGSGGGASGGAFAGVTSVLDGVGAHFGEVLRHMPGPVQRLVGDMSVPLMRRRRLQAAGEGTQQHRRGLQLPREQQLAGGGVWQHPVAQLGQEQRPHHAVAVPHPCAGTGDSRQHLIGTGRTLAQAWQGESWLLDDPYMQDDDGPAVQELVRQYAAQGHACPVFARKVGAPAAARFAEVAEQYILSV